MLSCNIDTIIPNSFLGISMFSFSLITFSFFDNFSAIVLNVSGYSSRIVSNKYFSLNYIVEIFFLLCIGKLSALYNSWILNIYYKHLIAVEYFVWLAKVSKFISTSFWVDAFKSSPIK